MTRIVTYAGDDDDGDPLFDMPLPIPDPVEFDTRPTKKMQDAADDLFGIPLEVTYSQAHALLSCRDYGRQCSAKILDRHPRRFRDLFGKIIAIYMLADEGRLADVLAWAERRRVSQSQTSAVDRTKRFDEVEDWLADLFQECREQGAAFLQS